MRRLRIPNREVGRLYRKEIVDRFAEMAGNRDYLRDMHRALVTGNAEVLESELERVLANSASFFVLCAENSYHMLCWASCSACPATPIRSPTEKRATAVPISW